MISAFLTCCLGYQTYTWEHIFQTQMHQKVWNKTSDCPPMSIMTDLSQWIYKTKCIYCMDVFPHWYHLKAAFPSRDNRWIVDQPCQISAFEVFDWPCEIVFVLSGSQGQTSRRTRSSSKIAISWTWICCCCWFEHIECSGKLCCSYFPRQFWFWVRFLQRFPILDILGLQSLVFSEGCIALADSMILLLLLTTWPPALKGQDKRGNYPHLDINTHTKAFYCNHVSVFHL